MVLEDKRKELEVHWSWDGLGVFSPIVNVRQCNKIQLASLVSGDIVSLTYACGETNFVRDTILRLESCIFKSHQWYGEVRNNFERIGRLRK